MVMIDGVRWQRGRGGTDIISLVIRFHWREDHEHKREPFRWNGAPDWSGLNNLIHEVIHVAKVNKFFITMLTYAVSWSPATSRASRHVERSSDAGQLQRCLEVGQLTSYRKRTTRERLPCHWAAAVLRCCKRVCVCLAVLTCTMLPDVLGVLR